MKGKYYMEQEITKINGFAVTGQKFRRLVFPKSFTKNWVRIDSTIIEEKYRLKSMNFRKYEPIDKNKILYRGNLTMNDTFAFTEKFNNFNGRIITKEAILYNEEKEASLRVEWDCGATYSSISEELAQELGLQPCGTERTISTTSSELSNVYTIILILHNEIGIPLKVNAASNIHNFGIDMLIGMDVIALGDFSISTYNGETYFSFRYPSQGLIDFTK